MIEVVIKRGDRQLLRVVSDGEARYTVEGDSLRDNAGSYETDDDLHVIGLINQQLAGINSHEYLLRRLNEHKAETVESPGKEDA